MSTAESLVRAALKVLEQVGESQFSTRAVCAEARVTAPTLYHHFGSSDALLSAAIALAFDQFLRAKKGAVLSPDPLEALARGWDNFVGFASDHPRLYSAMMARLLQGADIPAAVEAQAMLKHQIEAASSAGRLAVPAVQALGVLWASANGAALLCVTSANPGAGPGARVDPAILANLRDTVLESISNPPTKEIGS